jgi:photosystem II biogenesis protein Psp29
VNNLRTVSDTKRDFYKYHTRPINSIYRRVVEEMMVEMHLLSVNTDFRYDSIYALGVVSTFDSFMVGYSPESDRQTIFSALCQCVGGQPETYRQDAAKVNADAAQMTPEQVVACFSFDDSVPAGQDIHHLATAIATNPKFKYSRLFATGVYRLLEIADPEFVKSGDRFKAAIQKISEELHFSVDKIQKDLEVYQGNLEKMSQVLEVIQDTLKADRKKREERLEGKVEAKPEDQKESAGD